MYNRLMVVILFEWSSINMYTELVILFGNFISSFAEYTLQRSSSKKRVNKCWLHVNNNSVACNPTVLAKEATPLQLFAQDNRATRAWWMIVGIVLAIPQFYIYDTTSITSVGLLLFLPLSLSLSLSLCSIDNTPMSPCIQTGPHRWNRWTTWCWCANPVRLRSRRAAPCCPPAALSVVCPSIQLWTTCSVSFTNSDYPHQGLCDPSIKAGRDINYNNDM